MAHGHYEPAPDLSTPYRPSWLISDEEIAACEESGVTYVELQVAYDGMAVMTSVDNDQVECVNFADLYALQEQDLLELEGFGEVSAGNLLESIEASKELPLSRLLILIGNAITPGRGFREGPFSSEVELRELVDMASDRGVVDAGEREMIHSVFELGDTIAREVMVPRTEIIWIEQTKSVRQALALSLRTGFSRLPVIAESVDDIVGEANLKELVQHTMEQADGPLVPEVMRPASFEPDSKRLAVLLKEMQLSRNHMAIAVDEYGGTAGLLTIEDILEEIVGEITDEYDTDERPPVEPLDGGSVRGSARLPVEDLGELCDIELEHAGVETVGGLLAQRLGRVPLPGAVAELNGLRLHAEGGKDSRGRMRITTVLVERADDSVAAGQRAEERSDIGA